MKSLVGVLFKGILEDLGYSLRLSKLLREPGIRADLAPPAANIAASSVVRWQDFGKHAPLSWPRRAQGEMVGWRWSDGRYSSFVVQRPEIRVLTQCSEAPGWRCDIARVDGFSGSKSRLEDFASTDEMVETNSKPMIDRIDDDKLAENLAHEDIRILHDPATSDHLRYCAWDRRVFLMNSGGSHHLAAAKYLAARLDRRVPIEGKLVSYRLNSAAVEALCRDFEIFALNNDGSKHANAFHDAMSRFRATWLWLPLPHPYGAGRAVFLPRNHARSVCVANALRRADLFDLGRHLLTEVGTQRLL